MTRDEMIEAGARALHAKKPRGAGHHLAREWEQLDDDWKAAFRETSAVVLLATVPGIMVGTHAELPIEATEAMQIAGAESGECRKESGAPW